MSDNPNPAPLPEDEPTEDELAAASAMRPIEELPSAWTVRGNPRMLAEPTLKALSPEDQQTVREAAGSSDPDAIQSALISFLRDKQAQSRIMYGAGNGATEPERAALEVMNQVRLYQAEAASIEAELAEVAEAKIEQDENGEQFAVPVYRVQGNRRTASERRLAELRVEISRLSGVDGEAAIKRAIREEALKQRAVKAQIQEREEINRRAHSMAAEKRINEAAANKARFL